MSPRVFDYGVSILELELNAVVFDFCIGVFYPNKLSSCVKLYVPAKIYCFFCIGFVDSMAE